MTPRTSQHVSPEITAPFPEGGLFRFLQLVVGMLVTARLWYPPEIAVFGETLWITQAWLTAVVLWAWDAYRRADFRLRWDAFDVAVWMLVAGHVLSTLFVLGGQGDGRSAFNLMWEWVGLGASFFLLRQTLRTQCDYQRLMTVMLATTVMLASHGLWQHYVEMPRIASDYERVRQELEVLSSGRNKISRGEAIRLERELMEMGVPQDPVSRSLWENRLRSTEPFATFALANTLAGFLAAWLLVGVLAVGVKWSSITIRDAGKLAGLLVVAYCLVLTKSRTAWVGLFAGVLGWGIARRSGSLFSNRRWWVWGTALACVAVLFFAVAALSGGFDREVISEAPKSLKYRLQYWVGSWEVVKNQPWFGTGPGNFRQHYLQYKLPEASEEIADPHNWFFDLWANGGLLALLGFLFLIALCLRVGLDSSRFEEKAPSSVTARFSAWDIGAFLSFLLVLCVRWLSGEIIDATLLWLALVWVGAWGILRTKPEGDPSRAGILAAGLALVVHLLGAGGIEMPAIVQTLLLLVIFFSAKTWQKMEHKPAPMKSLPIGVLAVGVIAMVFSGYCLKTGTLPVWYRTILIHSGDATIQQGQNPKAAAREYELAREADPYSPEPLDRLAGLAFQLWQRNGEDREFYQAIKWGELAIKRDPVSHTGYRLLGQWSFQRAEKLGSSEAATQAAKFFAEAVNRYPHFAPLRAEWALALNLAEDFQAAKTQAERALELDQINRDAGHREKFLSPSLLEKLKAIASEKTSGNVNGS